MLSFGGKTFALNEVDYPFEVSVDNSSDNLDIKSKGFTNFDKQLTHGFSAHPKVDRKTNELLTFGADMLAPLFHFTSFDKDMNCISKVDVPITSPRMIHDFCVTQNHVVIPDLPLEIDIEKGIKENKPF